jgi:hypothetical protein
MILFMYIFLHFATNFRSKHMNAVWMRKVKSYVSVAEWKFNFTIISMNWPSVESYRLARHCLFCRSHCVSLGESAIENANSQFIS